MTTNFDIQLAKPEFTGNIVIKITDIDSNVMYFTQREVDSGLSGTIYNGYVLDASVNGETIDLRDVKSSIPTVRFTLLDKDQNISGLIGPDETGWMNYEVAFYYGFGTGSFGWSSYELISTTRITGYNKTANKYTFSSKAPTDLLRERIYTTQTQLDGDISDADTTISLVDATNLASSGTINIEGEFITYSGKSTNDLTGATRGQLGSDASEHKDGSDVFQVTQITDESMNIALDIILTQVGVDSALVDSVAFTDLRDGDLDGDGNYVFQMFDIKSALTWLEENILIAVNCRLVNRDGKISIALLDQVAFASTSEQINESHIIGDPGYKVDVNKVVNSVTMKYDYNWGTEKFETVAIFTDSDSITNFGLKETLTHGLKGITTANNGAQFVQGKANKLLARLSTPTAEIDVTTLFNRFNIQTADKVFVEHRYLPGPGSGGDFAYELEVLSRAPSDFKDNPKVKFKLGFTSYAALRYGLISPSPLISAVTSQAIFTVPDGTLFEVGYNLRLWNDTTGDYYADAAIAISGIAGNIITMASVFSTTLTTSVRVVFPEYDDSTAEQQAKYAYTCPDTNVFVSDSSKAYEIIP